MGWIEMPQRSGLLPYPKCAILFIESTGHIGIEAARLRHASERRGGSVAGGRCGHSKASEGPAHPIPREFDARA
jgi:hypothetical protein